MSAQGVKMLGYNGTNYQPLNVDNQGSLKTSKDYVNDLRYQRSLGNCYAFSQTILYQQTGSSNRKFILRNESTTKNIYVFFTSVRVSDTSQTGYVLESRIKVCNLTNTPSGEYLNSIHNLKFNSVNTSECKLYSTGTEDTTTEKILDTNVGRFSASNLNETLLNEDYMNEMIEIPPNACLVLRFDTPTNVQCNLSVSGRFLELEGEFPIV